jgi:hypothetical protein
MVGSGVAPEPADCEGFGTMPRTDVEQHLENLDHRLARIEQILPTLASRAELVALRERTEILIESTRDDIRLVAEGIASLTERLERKGVI